jgi:hypothetical protein
MPNYKLVNPNIQGTLSTSYDASSPLNAANSFWNDFTKHIYNGLPKFAFSMKDDDGKLHNFICHEKESGDSENFNIEEVEVKSSDANKLEKRLQQLGGQTKEPEKKKKRNDDDDDDEDEEDAFDTEDERYNRIRYNRNLTAPIVYWWYTPALYTQYLKSFYMPTFYKLAPYVEVEVILE